MTVDLARPWCCPEPRCALREQGHHGEKPLSEPQPGRSWVCFGQMPDGAVSFTYDGIDHSNSLNVCFYAPTKGLIRFQMNAGDLWYIAGDFARALKQIAPDDWHAWWPIPGTMKDMP